MRLWSVHPKHLDSKGLVAAWREGLLAQKVLLGLTKGYKNHPQLARFKNTSNPIEAIGAYLTLLYCEATKRGYKFELSKINTFGDVRIPLNSEQLQYEIEHLKNKVALRSPKELARLDSPIAHSMFNIIDGPVETWEVIKK